MESPSTVQVSNLCSYSLKATNDIRKKKKQRLLVMNELGSSLTAVVRRGLHKMGVSVTTVVSNHPQYGLDIQRENQLEFD